MSAQARPLFEFPLRTRLFIDGAWCVPETKQRLPVVNPSTEETIVEVEAGGPADVVTGRRRGDGRGGPTARGTGRRRREAVGPSVGAAVRW